jgi:chorismate mutase
MDTRSERLYVVHEDILPEALLKTVQVKELLARKQEKTVRDAVNRVGMSRSAYYKYKDRIFPFSELKREQFVTLSMDLRHYSGVLSKVLSVVAGFNGNLLTIHQTFPLQGVANVVMTVDASLMKESVEAMVDGLSAVDGVESVQVIGRG